MIAVNFSVLRCYIHLLLGRRLRLAFLVALVLCIFIVLAQLSILTRTRTGPDRRLFANKKHKKELELVALSKEEARVSHAQESTIFSSSQTTPASNNSRLPENRVPIVSDCQASGWADRYMALEFRGQLGNHMFQYASAVSLAIAYNYTLLLDPLCSPDLFKTFHISHATTHPCHFARVAPKCATPEWQPAWTQCRPSQLVNIAVTSNCSHLDTQLVLEARDKPVLDVQVEQKLRLLQSATVAATSNENGQLVILRGYLQSFKYFHHPEFIRREFTIHEQV